MNDPLILTVMGVEIGVDVLPSRKWKLSSMLGFVLRTLGSHGSGWALSSGATQQRTHEVEAMGPRSKEGWISLSRL
jgi:hypothetical protein